MGYILPIQHHQYQDYHRRTAGTTENPFVLERPFRIELNNKLKEKKKEEKQKKQTRPLTIYAARNVHAIEHTEKLLAELTGKGQHVNEQI
ncbi:hypothetical protein EDD68_10936 [Melghiribacillus thermohalophilus]|uniref:Uncharacterized protein n=1 Tax=Melghiribacillus thermohalophilus TaxID=1324956 RepID=A0A4R3N056_9BACI|nr:hypothetical protein [Melghiribacillus thermohalophilus]TCT22390.1 hypothetical protein EDD68_10936 [Melghiribacillus thermohalophilus]